jgi:hypothetical protein
MEPRCDDKRAPPSGFRYSRLLYSVCETCSRKGARDDFRVKHNPPILQSSTGVSRAWSQPRLLRRAATRTLSEKHLRPPLAACIHASQRFLLRTMKEFPMDGGTESALHTAHLFVTSWISQQAAKPWVKSASLAL